MHIDSGFSPSVDPFVKEIVERVVFRAFSEMERDSYLRPLERWEVVNLICRNVKVSIVSIFDAVHEGEDVAGACWFTDSESSLSAFEWTIGLAAGTPSSIFTMLVHESIHLGQHLTGRLSTVKHSDGTHSSYWLGMDMSHLSYEDAPWEIEAYRNEELWLLDMLQDSVFVEMMMASAKSCV